MFISVSEAKKAERVAKAQRIAAGRWLLVNESKVTSPKDIMLLHRVRAAAAEGSATFDAVLSDMDVNRLYNDGALNFGRVGQ